MVAHLNGVQEVMGSNPIIPTMRIRRIGQIRFFNTVLWLAMTLIVGYDSVMTPEIDPAVLTFFAGHEDALDLYMAFECCLYSSFPMISRRVQKTQITFSNRHVFACVSFARVKRKKELPPGYLVITLGLPAPVNAERIAVRTEPYPGRWTHHIVISRTEELDEELLAWIEEAYVFAEVK